MKYQLTSKTLSLIAADCLVIGCYNDKKLNRETKELDSKTNGVISSALASGQNLDKKGGFWQIPTANGIKAKSVLIINFGAQKELTIDLFRRYLHKALSSIQARSIAINLFNIKVATYNNSELIKQVVELSQRCFYEFDQYKSQTTKTNSRTITIAVNEKEKSKVNRAFREAVAIVEGMHLAKDLGNTPSNVCTPSYLLKQAQSLAKQYPKIKTSSINEEQMKKMGMGAIYSVTKGSSEPGYLITINYQGSRQSKPPIAFVGKGVTFDTGGNTIKSYAGMLGMKYDMGGGACVLGLIKAIAELNLPINVVGVIGAVENMVDGSSSKPEDIVTTLSGITVEITNTDAEGRLVLCDALSYVKRFKPHTVIDFATLTGAAIVALGNEATALYSNNQSLANKLLKSGEKSRDRAWQMPLWKEYTELLSSPFADLLNLNNGSVAGSITAACFLAEFAKDYNWAHLDIAGTFNRSHGNSRAAVGRPIPLIMEYILNQAK